MSQTLVADDGAVLLRMFQCLHSAVRLLLSCAQCTVKFTYFQLWTLTELAPPVVMLALVALLAVAVLARAAGAGFTAWARAVPDARRRVWGALRAAGAEARSTAGGATDAVVGGAFTLLYYT